MGVPVMKASYFAGNVASLSVLGAREVEARARLAPIIAQLQARSRLDWVPAAWDVELTHLVHELGGPAAVRDLNRRSFLASLEGPLLRPMFEGAVKLFGMTPRSMLKFSTMAWDAGARDLGVMRTSELRDDGGTIEHGQLPDLIVGDAIWAEGICGFVQGACEFTRHPCLKAEITFVDPRTYRCEARWKS